MSQLQFITSGRLGSPSPTLHTASIGHAEVTILVDFFPAGTDGAIEMVERVHVRVECNGLTSVFEPGDMRQDYRSPSRDGQPEQFAEACQYMAERAYELFTTQVLTTNHLLTTPADGTPAETMTGEGA